MFSSVPSSTHRPWPLPSRPWIMRQKWHDLLFMHWRIPPQTLRPLIRAALEIDHFEGSAWLGIVPFRMTGVRLRGTPGIPGLSAFPELNVRTYVSAGGKPGVWFFSLDAASTTAVAAARAWFHLPYFRARMSLEAHGDEIRYQSHRTHRDTPPATCESTMSQPARSLRRGQARWNIFSPSAIASTLPPAKKSTGAKFTTRPGRCNRPAPKLP